IVSQIFNDLGFSDFEFRAAGGKKREYCVQHNESDLNFISRLLEEDGIAYFFQHSEGKHQLVLVDQPNSYSEVSETNLEYSKGSAPHAQITGWEHKHNFKKGKWTLNEYNFKEPKKDLTATIKSNSNFAKNSEFEHYEYPAYYDPALGSELVKIALESEEADRNTVYGQSNCASFYAGGKFKLAKHATASQKGNYILAAVTHQAEDKSYFSGDQGSATYI